MEKECWVYLTKSTIIDKIYYFMTKNSSTLEISKLSVPKGVLPKDNNAKANEEIINRAIENTRKICEILMGRGRTLNIQKTFVAQIRKTISEIEEEKGYKFYIEVMEKFTADNFYTLEAFKNEIKIQASGFSQSKIDIINRAKYILNQKWKIGSKATKINGDGSSYKITGIDKNCKLKLEKGPNACNPTFYKSSYN